LKKKRTRREGNRPHLADVGKRLGEGCSETKGGIRRRGGGKKKGCSLKIQKRTGKAKGDEDTLKRREVRGEKRQCRHSEGGSRRP